MAEDTKRGMDEVRLERLRKERHESRAGSTYKKFLGDLSQVAKLDEARAEEAAVSVLCTLERRLISGEAEQLEAQLPFKLRELLVRCERHEGLPPVKFGRDEFLRMVADDLRVDDPGEAERIVRSVFLTVRALVSVGEAEDVEHQLPADLRELWRRPS